MNYIINRLCEESTWAGIYLSAISLITMVIEKYNISHQNIIYVIAILTFVASQILIWTRDYTQTKTKLDDILNAAANALLLKFNKK